MIPTTTQVLTVLELMEGCKATVIINVLLSIKDFEGGILLMNTFKILPQPQSLNKGFWGWNLLSASFNISFNISHLCIVICPFQTKAMTAMYLAWVIKSIWSDYIRSVLSIIPLTNATNGLKILKNIIPSFDPLNAFWNSCRK